MSQLMVSFRGTQAPPWVLEGVRQGSVSAVCLFAFNVESPGQLRELAEALRRAAREGNQPPPLLGIDQEGGQLMAVSGGVTELPGNMALGATGSPQLAERAGRVLGIELAAMGCNLNFAPVLDLSHHPDNPAVGVRSFGDRPGLVAELGAAFIRGLQSAGVLATAKHFPGHGDTRTDSHHQVPVVARGLARLEAEELVPFRAAIAAGVGAVMSAHVRYPDLDELPATLSERILGGLLRRRLGFEGLIITDAMDMGALAAFGAEERCRAALAAGADLVMLGHLEGQKGLLSALADGFDPRSGARIGAARLGLAGLLPAPDVIGCAEHRRLAQEIADASITLVRGAGRLPLRLPPDARLAVVSVEPSDLTPADTSSAVTLRLDAAIRARHPNTVALGLPFGASRAALRHALDEALEAEVVVVGSINAHQDPAQVELLRGLQDRGQGPIVVGLRTPYELAAFPFVDTYLCAYGIRGPNTEAAAKVLFGETPARGKLPCALPGMPQGGVSA